MNKTVEQLLNELHKAALEGKLDPNMTVVEYLKLSEGE